MEEGKGRESRVSVGKKGGKEETTDIERKIRNGRRGRNGVDGRSGARVGGLEWREWKNFKFK